MDALQRLETIPQDVAGRSALSRLPRVLSDATDAVVASLRANLEGAALVAVGGYGRREQCVGSDIDLLILHRGGPPDVRAILYPLWDAKLKVGHSVRTIKECALAAREHVETLTALMDARLVVGDADLFRGFEKEMRGVVASMGATLRADLALEERVAQEREPYHSLSPDLKKSRGFLRTLQRVHWERRRQALAGSASLRESAQERAARLHFLAVRNALHLAGGDDRLNPELREAVARRLDMSVADLLTSLSRHAEEAERVAVEVFSAELERRSDPVAEAGRRIFWAVRRRSAISEGSDVLTTAVAALRSPNLAALDRAGQAGPAPWTRGDVDRLFEIVTAGPAGRRIWDALWRSGWLRRELPEWEPVVRAPQLAPIHSHPVDGHLFRTVDEVLALADSDDLARREAIDELGGPELAVWAGFFHDIGKGRPGDHSEVGAALVTEIAERLHLPGERLLTAAVRHHLLLPEVATRRDIEALDVVEGVVEAIGDPQLLRLLYVLAAADGRATGTASWTPWRAALIDRLYRRTLERLSQSKTQPDRAEAVALRLGIDAEVFRAHITQMGTGYLDRYDDEVLSAHLRLVETVPDVGEVRHSLLTGGTLATAIMVSRDVPGLAAALAAVCADNGISILEGRFERRADGIAIDTFVVTDVRGGPVGPARFAAAMNGIASVERRREPFTDIDVRTLSDGTIVELRGADRAGFLADVCGALADLGLDITLAKLDTRSGRALDVFYVDPPLDDVERLVAALTSPTDSDAGLP